MIFIELWLKLVYSLPYTYILHMTWIFLFLEKSRLYTFLGIYTFVYMNSDNWVSSIHAEYLWSSMWLSLVQATFFL